MNHFHYRDSQLHCEDVPVHRLAERFGTPLWIYSKRAILDQYDALRDAFSAVDPLICYSVKANGTLGILRVLAEVGSGFDVVSGGELFRVIEAGGKPEHTVFAGVGKTGDEIRHALQQGVLMLNVESTAELETIAQIARQMQTQAPVALRVNPDVDPLTHRHTSTGKKGTKFGIDLEEAEHLARQAADDPHLRLCGIHLHLGSPIYQVQPYAEGVRIGLEMAHRLQKMGIVVDWLNLGGGFAITYGKEQAPPLHAYAEAIVPALEQFNSTKRRVAGAKRSVPRSGARPEGLSPGHTTDPPHDANHIGPLRLILEPGRFIVGNAGILVSRVIRLKESGGRRFVIQDAGMNDLLRPVLYEAFHRIWPVHSAIPPPEDCQTDQPETSRCEIVGPVCETGDFLAQHRPLPPLSEGDLLATFSAGAYGTVMSSNYNARPRGAEVLVDEAGYQLVRRRETNEDMVAPER